MLRWASLYDFLVLEWPWVMIRLCWHCLYVLYHVEILMNKLLHNVEFKEHVIFLSQLIFFFLGIKFREEVNLCNYKNKRKLIYVSWEAYIFLNEVLIIMSSWNCNNALLLGLQLCFYTLTINFGIIELFVHLPLFHTWISSLNKTLGVGSLRILALINLSWKLENLISYITVIIFNFFVQLIYFIISYLSWFYLKLIYL